MEKGKKAEMEPETKQPEFPDLYGTCIMLPIKAHRPPDPFGNVGYKQEKTPGVEDISREAIGHLSVDEVTFARHPRERPKDSDALPDWLEFSNPPTAVLKIVAPISTGDRGPKVVMCEVPSPARDYWMQMGHKTMPTVLAAKIFDPLYYYDSPDMVGEADREYAQEAAAYIHMHDQRNTPTYTKKPGLVPRFYGSWTTDITLDHMRKPFMNQADRLATRKQETKDRVAFDAAAAATRAPGSSSKPTKLQPHKFRPVRIILLEYIKGYPLSSFLVTTRHEGDLIVNPTAEFASESKRLAIFGSILDTISRVEHLGIKLSNISPSLFKITKKPNPKTPRSGESEFVYDVVMTGFSHADVTKFTRMGFDLHEKLPRPMHPLCARSPLAWYLFYGWIPNEWFNLSDVSAYDNWGASYFKETDYSTQKVMNEVAEAVGWAEAMVKDGHAPPEGSDPKLQQLVQKKTNVDNDWARLYRAEKEFKTKEEFDNHKAEKRRIVAELRAAHDERERQKQADLERNYKERVEALKKAEREAEEKRRAKEAQFGAMGPHLDAPGRPAAPELEQDQEGTAYEHPQTRMPLRGVGSADFQPLSDPSSGTSGASHRRPQSSLAGTEETTETAGTGHTGRTAQTAETSDTAPTAVTADSGSVTAQGPRATGTPLTQHVEADDAEKKTKDDDDLYTAD